MSWLQTFTDEKFDLVNPTLDQVDVRVIAHALARICRFGGHPRQFYSVAQHSVIVSHHVPAPYALHALMHDAAEAYIGDVIRPLKTLLKEWTGGKYEAFEANVERVIWKRLGIEWTDDARRAVHDADERALATEARDLFGKPIENWTTKLRPELAIRIIPCNPDQAELGFLARYVEVCMGNEFAALPAKPAADQPKCDLAGAVESPNPSQSTANPSDPVLQGIPLSKMAHEIRLELAAPGLTRDENATIKAEVCRLYAKEHLSPREASYLQELIAANFRRIDGKGAA